MTETDRTRAIRMLSDAVGYVPGRDDDAMKRLARVLSDHPGAYVTTAVDSPGSTRYGEMPEHAGRCARIGGVVTELQYWAEWPVTEAPMGNNG